MASGGGVAEIIDCDEESHLTPTGGRTSLSHANGRVLVGTNVGFPTGGSLKRTGTPPRSTQVSAVDFAFDDSHADTRCIKQRGHDVARRVTTIIAHTCFRAVMNLFLCLNSGTWSV